MVGADVEGVTVLLGLNQAPSMNSVLRALKREESSLFSCVASIANDARFVEQVAACYPGLPLLPNLRCGVWYVRPQLGPTCYFKSTDGHNNNWSFSTVRLNLGVAQAAAAAGGCVIVDATRRGKRFPDAMSKTIPMWCAVMNRAIHRLRQQAAGAAAAPSAAAGAGEAAPCGALAAEQAAAGAAPGAVHWDCGLHLPPWVSDVERNSIQQRLDGWVDDLFGVKPDLSALAASLAKPLRCLWVSQDSQLWLEEGQVVDLASLPFTPIVLVNASASATRQRRCLTLPAEVPGEDPLSVSYSYCPGAADDEESWACGLTPELMWRHLRALLAAGPAGIAGEVRRLLVEQRRQLAGGAAGPAATLAEGAAAAWPAGKGSMHSTAQPGEALAARSAAHAAAAAAPPSSRQSSQPTGAAPAAQAPAVAAAPVSAGGVCTDPQQLGAGQHCLLPRGCLPAQSAAVQQVGSGVFLLGATGLALGSAAAAAAPAVWQHVDAVLHLGSHQVAGMEQEPQWCSMQAAAAAPAPAEAQQAPRIEAPSSSCKVAQTSAGVSAAAPVGSVDPAACRFCWLRVRSSKDDRHSLERNLPAALAFAGIQLAARRRLLLCCDSGLDAAACAAVACLLAFYRLEERPGAGGGLLPVWAGPSAAQPAGAPLGATAATPEGRHAGEVADAAEPPSAPAALRRFPPVPGAAGFDKLAVRQHLGVVSAHYPAGRPTRGMLKQVYNFFLGQL